jgi:hypothetical protein
MISEREREGGCSFERGMYEYSDDVLYCMLTSLVHVETMRIPRFSVMTASCVSMSTHSILSICIQEHDYNDMTTTTKLKPFHLQPLLSDLYYHKDLLDFDAAGTSYSATSWS